MVRREGNRPETHEFEKSKWYLVIEDINSKEREFYGPFDVIFNSVSGPNITLGQMGFKLDAESDGTLYVLDNPSDKVIWAQFKKGEWIKSGRPFERLHMTADGNSVKGAFKGGPKKGEVILPRDDFQNSKLAKS